MKIRTVASAAALSLLLVLGACGSDDPEPDTDPTPTATEDDDDTGLDKRDLEDALLTLDDVEGLGSDMEEQEVTDGGLDSESMIDGDEACADFLDGEYGPEEEEKVDAEFSSAEADLTVYSTVELYAEGEAEEELEATRDLFADCSTFTVEIGGDEVIVEVQTIELDELEGYGAGDEGLAVNMRFLIGGNPALSQGYTLVRIDDVLTISGAATGGQLGDAIMLPITEAAADRLQDVLDDAA